MSKKTAFTVDYERDEAGFWVASVAKLPGCHTQGRTIEQARRRIVEAIALHVEERQAQLTENIKIKPKLRQAIERARDARERADSEQATANEAMRRAAAQLEADGLSVRDCGQLLGLSHQRVHQLLHAADGRPKHARKTTHARPLKKAS